MPRPRTECPAYTKLLVVYCWAGCRRLINTMGGDSAREPPTLGTPADPDSATPAPAAAGTRLGATEEGRGEEEREAGCGALTALGAAMGMAPARGDRRVWAPEGAWGDLNAAATPSAAGVVLRRAVVGGAAPGVATVLRTRARGAARGR